MSNCKHDPRFGGVMLMPKGTNGCVACAYEQSVERIADLERQLAEAHQNAAFFRSCALSGEVPKEGAEPFPERTRAER